jgi:hypothetical protein
LLVGAQPHGGKEEERSSGPGFGDLIWEEDRSRPWRRRRGGSGSRGVGEGEAGGRTWAWAWAGGRCRFTEASGRCRFIEGRTSRGSLPLRALIGSIDLLVYQVIVHMFFWIGLLLASNYICDLIHLTCMCVTHDLHIAVGCTDVRSM